MTIHVIVHELTHLEVLNPKFLSFDFKQHNLQMEIQLFVNKNHNPLLISTRYPINLMIFLFIK